MFCNSPYLVDSGCTDAEALVTGVQNLLGSFGKITAFFGQINGAISAGEQILSALGLFSPGPSLQSIMEAQILQIQDTVNKIETQVVILGEKEDQIEGLVQNQWVADAITHYNNAFYDIQLNLPLDPSGALIIFNEADSAVQQLESFPATLASASGNPDVWHSSDAAARVVFDWRVAGPYYVIALGVLLDTMNYIDPSDNPLVPHRDFVALYGLQLHKHGDFLSRVVSSTKQRASERCQIGVPDPTNPSQPGKFLGNKYQFIDAECVVQLNGTKVCTGEGIWSKTCDLSQDFTDFAWSRKPPGYRPPNPYFPGDATEFATYRAIGLDSWQSVAAKLHASAEGVTYVGCFADAPQGATLVGTGYNINTCVTAAKMLGSLNYAFLTAGGTCLVGNGVTRAEVPDLSCSTPCTSEPGQMCGGSNSVSSVFRVQPTADTGAASSNGITYEGCYQDNFSRTLPVFNGNPNLTDTVETCLAWARQNGYQYFGLQYYGQCFGGLSLPTTPLQESTGCNTPCNGNSSEMCGGPWANSVFKIPQPAAMVASANGINYEGCFQDGATRTLPVLRSNPAMNDTVESCSNWAKAGGYGYFGLQYYGQCFAGNGLPPTPLPETSCNTACTGNSGETCGGAWANSVFSTSNTY